MGRIFTTAELDAMSNSATAPQPKRTFTTAELDAMSGGAHAYVPSNDDDPLSAENIAAGNRMIKELDSRPAPAETGPIGDSKLEQLQAAEREANRTTEPDGTRMLKRAGAAALNYTTQVGKRLAGALAAGGQAEWGYTENEPTPAQVMDRMEEKAKQPTIDMGPPRDFWDKVADTAGGLVPQVAEIVGLNAVVPGAGLAGQLSKGGKLAKAAAAGLKVGRSAATFGAQSALHSPEPEAATHGAGMGAVFGAIEVIPGASIPVKIGKTVLESVAMERAAALEGGSEEDRAIAFLLPWGIKGSSKVAKAFAGVLRGDVESPGASRKSFEALGLDRTTGDQRTGIQQGIEAVKGMRAKEAEQKPAASPEDVPLKPEVLPVEGRDVTVTPTEGKEAPSGQQVPGHQGAADEGRIRRPGGGLLRESAVQPEPGGEAGQGDPGVAGGEARPGKGLLREPRANRPGKGLKRDARETAGSGRGTGSEGEVPPVGPPEATEGLRRERPAEEELVDAASPGEFAAPSNVRRTLQQVPTAGVEATSPKDIIKFAEEMTGAPIRIGKTVARMGRGLVKAAGLYKEGPHVARTQVANDLDTTAHEVGHAIHKRLINMNTQVPHAVAAEMEALGKALYGKGPKPPRGYKAEGFAEYIARRAWGEDPQKFAPMVDNWFRNQVEAKLPEDAARLAQFKDMLSRWNAQGADARVEAAISWTGKDHKTLGQRAKDVYHKIQRAWVDDKEAMVRAERHAAQIADLKPGESPSVIAKVLQNSEAAAAADAIDRGVWSLKANKIIAPGIREAMQRLGKLDKQTYRDWVKFMTARHGIEMWKKGKNPGFSREDAESVYRLYENRPGFLSASNAVREFHRGLVDMYAEVGGLTKEAHDLILDSFSAYVPMKRLMDAARPGAKGNGGSTAKPVKRMSETGSGREVIDPVLATIQMAEDFYRAAAMTRVKRAIYDMQAKRAGGLTKSGEGMGKWIEEVPAPTEGMEAKIRDLAGQLKRANADLSSADLDAVLSITHQSEYYNGREPLISVMVDGKPKWFRLDPEYYTAVVNADPTRIDAFLSSTAAGKVLTTATKLKRLGATELRPSFGLYFNTLRDAITFPMRTKGWSVWAPLREMRAFAGEAMAGLQRARGKDAVDPIGELFDRYGGQGSGYVGQDLGKAYKQAQEVLNSAAGKEYKNIVRHPIDALRAVFSAFEKAPRLAEMELILKKHGYSRADLEAGKTPPPELVIEAVYAGMNVTTNFKAAGSQARILNKVNAYANAKIQDTVTDYRMMRDHPARTLVRGMAWMTIPTVLYWAAVHDEDWYKELPAWRKLAGWNLKIGDTPILIPSPFLLGMVFSRLPEAMLNYAYDKDPNAVGDWVKGIKQEYMPGAGTILPDAIEPAVEVAMNRDLFRDRPIISPELENRKAEDQYTRYTSSASKYAGWYLGLSPMKLDHLLRGYVPLAGDLAQIPDQGPARAAGLSRISRPMDKGRSVDDFYVERDRAEAEYNSAKMKGAVSPAIKNQYAKMGYYSDLMTEIRKAGSDDEQTNRYLTGLAMSALGLDELGEYPNPLTAANVPPAIKAARDKFIARKVVQITDPAPKKRDRESSKDFAERKARYQDERERAEYALKGLNLPSSQKKSLLRQEYKSRGGKADSAALQERMRRVR